MVFCYKVITETPRRSAVSSPRKRSPIHHAVRARRVPSSVSQLVGSVDYECESGDVLDSIPEREWRLLAALARKREEDDERERLADQFHKMWLKEKEERDLAEAETTEQYQRYLHEKRREERSWDEFRRQRKMVEHQLRKRQILDCIRDKEQRSADVLAWVDDRKASDMIDKAMEEQARALLAADRRLRSHEAEHYRKRLELADTLRRADDASQRLAITNALSSWETSVLRQEVLAMEAAQRGQHAARAALTDARASRLARARDARLTRARRLAALTRQMRDHIRMGRT